MTIKHSKGMIPCIYKTFFLDPGFKKSFGVFDGTVPLASDLRDWFDNNPNVSGFDSNIVGSNEVLRTSITFDVNFVAQQLATNFFRFETSQRAEEFENDSLGSATWFMFAIKDPSSTSITDTAETLLAFVGTIGGVEDDNADIRIVDELIGDSVNYLLNDLEFSFRV